MANLANREQFLRAEIERRLEDILAHVVPCREAKETARTKAKTVAWLVSELGPFGLETPSADFRSLAQRAEEAQEAAWRWERARQDLASLRGLYALAKADLVRYVDRPAPVTSEGK